MTLASRLVALAREATRSFDEGELKVRLLLNAAAALGDQVEVRPIRDALGGDSGPGSLALLLAAEMHARTQDDFHPGARVHVGTVVIPAVLAVGRGSVLPAMVAGYEVLTAVADAYADTAQRRGYRPTGVFGPIGAAAAAGVSMELDDGQLASALALASTMAAGTNRSWIDGTDEWLVEVAAAARAGVDSARLAASGVRGAPRAFEGSAGWAGAFFDDEGGSRLEASLDEDGRRTPTVAIKLYPVSGIAQVPTALAAELAAAHAKAEPERIEVRMASGALDYPGSRNRGPFRGRSDSLMSVSRCVALAYLHGAVPYRMLLGPPDGPEERLQEAIDLVADPDLDEAEAVVTVTTRQTATTRRGRTDDLLFPTWEHLAGESSEIARRSEAPEALVVELVGIIDAGGDVDEVKAVLCDPR